MIINCIKKKNCKYIKIKNHLSESFTNKLKKIPYFIFPSDVGIVYSLCSHLNIDEKTIIKGITNVSLDEGALKIWEYKNNNNTILFVNGFGANDPESTLKTIAKIKDIVLPVPKKITGLLCLRKDRGDRTLQWIKFLKNNQKQVFNRLYISGGYSGYAKRKLEKTTLIKTNNPELITEKIVIDLEDNSVLLGMGNFKGMGNRLVDYWEKIGDKYYAPD